MKSRYYFLISLILIVVMWGLKESNKYTEYHNHNVEVVQKYSGASGGKHSRMHFIVVYRTSDNIFFDRNVSAAWYSQIEPGDQVTLSLRQMDIKQNTTDNVIWFFGYVLFQVIFGFGALIIFVLGCSPKLRKWMVTE
uniref:Membrane protein n=1 Tax=Pantoea phage Survivor TaxID=3232176 RepID=A0AAU8L0U1_9CAUD